MIARRLDVLAIGNAIVDVIADADDAFLAANAMHKGAMRLINASPHAAELYSAHDQVAAAQFSSFDAEVATALEAALSRAGVGRARLVTQMLLAASFGIGHKATNPAELGPALRLLAERLVRPELPTR